MAIDFPNSPVNGQTFTSSNGTVWTYDGTKWTASPATGGGGPGYLPLSGGTLTGSLTLAADPTTSLGAATKNYVDTHSAGLTDAPSDSSSYGRLNATWAKVAPLASPGLTGTPTAPTATAGTSTTQLATTAFVAAAIIALTIPAASSTTPIIDGTAAIGTLLTYARGDHVHPTDTSRAPLASPGLTGVPTAPTAALSTNTTQLATTAFVQAAIGTIPAPSSTTPAMDGTATIGVSVTYARADHIHPTDTSRAPLASPTFTGTPAAPTATAGTNTTQLATTAFVTAAVGGYLPLAGGTLTGPLILAGDPIAALGAATKQYVDGTIPPKPNRVDNGDMSIDQHNAGASHANTGSYITVVDRFLSYGTVASKYTAGRDLGAGAVAAGFAHYLGVQSSSAYTPAATDVFGIYHGIEADFVSDFAWGTAGAQAGTLSFWVTSSLTGTFSGVVQNSAASRSYPFTYSIGAANTWTKISITIPGDTAGTWLRSGNGVVGIAINFDLGTGATNRGPAGAWAAANYNGATGGLNVVATNAAKWSVTGVKFEIGSVATGWVYESLSQKIARCQRYFCKSYDMGAVPGAITGNGSVLLQAPAAGAGGLLQYIPFPVRMCGVPTVTSYGPQSGSSGQVRLSTGSDAAASVQDVGEGGASIGYSGATSIGSVNFHWTAAAEI